MSRLIQSKPIVNQEYQWVDDTNHRHTDKLAFGDQQEVLQLIEWIEQEGVSHDFVNYEDESYWQIWMQGNPIAPPAPPVPAPVPAPAPTAGTTGGENS